MGLDIEALAIKLAKEGNLPPVQTHIFIEPKRAQNSEKKSVNSTIKLTDRR